MKEVQITRGDYGHTLNASQVFSPDGQWVIYDTRNEDSHISRTSRIEKVNLRTGEVVKLYDTGSENIFGPGVGAVAYHPVREEAIFIHGLLNSSEEQPYSFTRRFGAIINTLTLGGFVHADGRNINPPFLPGNLRGGTHAHTWNSDGSAISFTYNDYIMEQRERITNGQVKDLRTTGIMIHKSSPLSRISNDEEFGGNYFSFVTAMVIENPAPGSDSIDRAFDECWIGTNGYIKKDGTAQKRAIAFQRNVRGKNNDTITEVFISDIPQDLAATALHTAFAGTHESRPQPPDRIVQRRITFTTERRNAGIQGPRCRLRSSPDGKYIYFHMKDDNEIVQVYRVLTTGGEPEQVTFFQHSITAQYNLSADGNKLSCVVDDALWIVDLTKRSSQRLINGNGFPTVGGALWAQNGKQLVFNRYVPSGTNKYLQIFSISTAAGK